MFKVITKEVATYEGPKMVFGLRTRMVFVGLFAHVRQESTKEKELKRGESCRNHPENNQVFSGQYQFE